MTSLLETARQLRSVNLTVARLGREAWRETVTAQARLTSSETSHQGRSALITAEQLRAIQERERRLASPTELARAESLGDLHDGRCPLCDGARMVAVRVREGEPAVPMPCECMPLEERATRAGIPRRFLDADLDTMRQRPGNGAAIAFAGQWDGRQSVLLYGDVGTGKSHLASAMLRRRLALGWAGRFVSVADLMDELKARFGGEGEQSEAYFDRLAREPFLVLDDVGAEQETPWTRERVASLIDRRYRAEAPTIVTTNLTHRDLAARYGKRLADRLREWAWVEMAGKSMRAEKAGAA